MNYINANHLVRIYDVLTPPEIREVQETVVVLLYYACAIYSMLLVALNTVGSQQFKITKNTQDVVTHLLQYCASHPDATVRYYASNIVMHVHSDASYLSCLQAWSRAGGFFFFSF